MHDVVMIPLSVSLSTCSPLAVITIVKAIIRRQPRCLCLVTEVIKRKQRRHSEARIYSKQYTCSSSSSSSTVGSSHAGISSKWHHCSVWQPPGSEPPTARFLIPRRITSSSLSLSLSLEFSGARILMQGPEGAQRHTITQ